MLGGILRKEARPSMLKALRILLAEDERTISRLIRQVLTSAGHEVIGVQTAADAIANLKAGSFDLILLDLNLADGDGFRVVDAVRLMAGDNTAPVPVLLMTGEHHFEDNDPRMAQVSGVLWKPFALDDLERAVGRFSA